MITILSTTYSDMNINFVKNIKPCKNQPSYCSYCVLNIKHRTVIDLFKNTFGFSNALKYKQMLHISIKRYLLNFMSDMSDNWIGKYPRGHMVEQQIH